MDSPATDQQATAPSLSNKPYLFSLGLLFLAAMHYYQPNGGGEGLSLAFNNTVWIAISLIIAVGACRLSATKQIVYTGFDAIGLVAIVLLALPLLWAESPWREATFDRYLAIIAFWLIILTHRQFSLNKEEYTVFWALIGGAVLIQCLIGLVQYAHTGEWAIIPNGRPSGTFQQVNVYASFLATGLAVSVYQLCQPALNRYLAIMYLLVIFLVGTLQWLVLSRTGILGSSLVLIGLSLLYRHRKQVLLKIWVLLILGVSAAMVLQNITAVEGRGIDSAASPGYRTVLYSLSWELIKEKPLLGHGLGKFQTVFLDKQAVAYAEGRIYSIHGSVASSHPHNEVLFWWVEAGVLPILVFVVLLGLVVVSQVKKQNRLVIAIISLPIVLHTQTEYPLYHSSVHLVLLALLFACMTSTAKRAVALQYPRLPMLFGGFVVLLSALFMATNLQAMYLLGRYLNSDESQYLVKILNPFGQPHHVNRFRSQQLAKVSSPDSLALAEKLLMEEIALRPGEGVYVFLYDVYRLQGKKDEAEMALLRAKRLFPASGYFESQ